MRRNRQRCLGLVLAVLLGAACAPPASRPPPEPAEWDGYDDPVPTGLGFLVDDMALTPVQQSLDLDGDSLPDAAVNRALAPMATAINDAFRSSVQTGRICVALELVGVDDPYGCDDRSVTIKYFTCEDADQDPANNFCGAPECGHAVLDPNDLDGDQALYRTEPAPVQQCRLATVMDQTIMLKLDEDDLPMERTRFAVFIPDTLRELMEIRIAGSARIRDTQRVSIPICRYMPILCINPNTPDEISLAQYMRLIGEHPDLDMDGDGLERYDLDGQAQVVRCIDGDGTIIESPTCLDDPRIADAFSMCLGAHAVSAVLQLP
ncbi:MAG: hypothetical protein ABIJ09_08190 [Pseudomonadota bacterium]